MNSIKHCRVLISAISFLLLLMSDCDNGGKEFENYLTEESWEVERVINTCNSADVTDDFTDFVITFTMNDSESDSSRAVFNYTSSNGAPAFNSSGKISVLKSDLKQNNISATRDDSVEVLFRNLEDNIKSEDTLEFDVIDIVECNGQADKAGKSLVQNSIRGDLSFRCRRRRR